MSTVGHPQVNYRYPTLNTGKTSALRPDIVIGFNTDVETSQFSDNGTRALIFTLLEESTGAIIETEYISYDSVKRRVTLRPTSDLDRSATYTAILDKHIVATTGRKSLNSFSWQFETAEGDIVQSGDMSPANYTVQEIFPTFSWPAATLSGTGTVLYDFELSNNISFGTTVYSSTVSGLETTPVGAFSDNTTYYWRVRPYSVTATGNWSDIYSFYYGTSSSASESTRRSWKSSEVFGVVKSSFDKLTHQVDFPTIYIDFSSAPASSVGDHIIFTQRSVFPRNDTPASYQSTVVSGLWSVSGNRATFVPSGTIETNTRYDILLLSTLESQDGDTLGTDIKMYFTGRYTPYYCSLMDIRAKFLSNARHIPDDLINYYIFKASLSANARYQYSGNDIIAPFGDNLSEAIVRDSAALQSYSVGRWVEAKATYDILKHLLMELATDIDSRRKLGDFEYSLGPGVLKAFELLLKKAEDDLLDAEELLVSEDNVIIGLPGRLYGPKNACYDLLTRDLESKRGFQVE